MFNLKLIKEKRRTSTCKFNSSTMFTGIVAKLCQMSILDSEHRANSRSDGSRGRGLIFLSIKF